MMNSKTQFSTRPMRHLMFCRSHLHQHHPEAKLVDSSLKILPQKHDRQALLQTSKLISNLKCSIFNPFRSKS